MVKVGNMTRARRILLIATLLVVSVGSASASLWRHRAKKPEQATPANTAAAAMTLTAIEVGAPSQIVLRTSGAPAFTSLSPTPNQFVVDLSGTARGTALAIPTPLPAGISAIVADEVTEMGSMLTRVTVKFTQGGTAQAAADGNSVIITLPPPAIAEVPKSEPAPVPVAAMPIQEAPKVITEPLPVADAKPLRKAKALKKIETSGTGNDTDVQIATDGEASYSAFKLANPARVVIDLAGIKDKMTKHTIEVDKSIVKRIRTAQYKPDVTRVVLDLNEASTFNITKMGDRLHVTFGNAAPQVAATADSGAPPPPAVIAAEGRGAAQEPAKPAPT